MGFTKFTNFPPRISLFARDCREFDNFVLTFIIYHQKFIMQFINITNNALVNTC